MRLGLSTRTALAAIAGALGLSAAALGQGGNVVISQYYGGGGFQPGGPVFDCVELFNRTGSPINLSGWSLQVVASSNWAVIPLTGTIPARGYYLVRTGASFDVNVGVPLTFDDSASPLLDTSAFTSGAGRVALIRNTTSLGPGTVCPVGLPDTEDVLTVGTGACPETAGAPGGSTASNPPTNTRRKLAGCQDTDNNSQDFEVVSPPNMRNSSSPPLPASNFLSGSAGTNPVNAGSTTAITVNMQSCGGTPISLTGVTGDLSAFGLSATEAFTGSGTGPWTYTLNVPIAQPSATYTVNLTGSDGTSTYPGSVSFRVIGPPPANDQCVNAALLTTLPLSVQVDNSSATSDVDPGACNTGTVGNFGVWYRFDATQSGILTIAETSTQATAIGIWTTPTAGATCPASSTGSVCSTATTVPVVVSPGNTYFIQVGSSGSATPTVPLDLTFSFEAVAAPANDLCSNAVVLTTLPQTFVVDNRTATSDLDPGACNTGTVGNSGVWYRFDATQTGTLNLNETSAQVVAYGIWAVPTTGAACPTTGAATTCSTTQNLSFGVVSGTTYFIQVGSSGTTIPTASINLTVTFIPPPANDECPAATFVSTGLNTLSNTSATTSAAPLNSVPCPLTASSFFSDVWYKWQAPANGRVAFVSNVGIAGRYAVYDGGAAPGVCPSAATPIQCQSTGTAISNNAAAPIPVVAGNIYFIQFGITTATGTQGALELEITFDPDSTGSCCVGSACTVLAPAQCTSAGGTYGGDGSLCSASAGSIDAYAGSGGAIPDFVSPNPGVFTSTINVPDSFTVNDVELEINFTHTYNGDLAIRLSKGSVVQTVHARGRRGMSGTTNISADFNGVYRFNDIATGSVFSVLGTGAPSVVPAGTYRPAGTGGLGLSMQEAFNGVSSAGDWTLTITDYTGADVGTVTGWVLRLTRGNASPCTTVTGVCCRGAICSSTITQAACVTSGTQWGASFSTASGTCNVSGNATSPCCHADYDKTGGIQVADIFAFLNDWFASSAFADFGGDGTVTPDVNDIFDFLNAWFAGGC